jgi:hypothetical protein
MTNNRRANLSDPVHAGVDYRDVLVDYAFGKVTGMPAGEQDGD